MEKKAVMKNHGNKEEICGGDIHRYDDIIYLPHPVSKSHPQMSISDRAAQFAPFAALTGYGAAIRETARLTDEMTDLDENRREALDETLSWIQGHLKEQTAVTVAYFQPDDRKAGGAYGSMTGKVRKIDAYGRKLVLMDGTMIPIEYIVGIELENAEQGKTEEHSPDRS